MITMGFNKKYRPFTITSFHPLHQFPLSSISENVLNWASWFSYIPSNWGNELLANCVFAYTLYIDMSLQRTSFCKALVFSMLNFSALNWFSLLGKPCTARTLRLLLLTNVQHTKVHPVSSIPGYKEKNIVTNTQIVFMHALSLCADNFNV